MSDSDQQLDRLQNLSFLTCEDSRRGKKNQSWGSTGFWGAGGSLAPLHLDGSNLKDNSLAIGSDSLDLFEYTANPPIPTL